MEKIPKKIHQIFLDFNKFKKRRCGYQVARYKEFSEYPSAELSRASFKRDYPDFEYTLWGSEEIDKLLSLKKYNLIKRVYNRVSPIEKTDIARYVILQEHGGMYVDLDMVSQSPIPNICKHEAMGHVQYNNKHPRLANDFLCMSEAHPLMTGVLEEIWQNRQKIYKITRPERDVIFHTGPARLHRTCTRRNLWSRITIRTKTSIGKKGAHIINFGLFTWTKRHVALNRFNKYKRKQET